METDPPADQAPPGAPDIADEEADAGPVPDTSSNPPPKKRKDDNWRVSRAVKSAQRKADKAVAARDVAREACVDSEAKLRVADDRVKQVEHEQYLDKKAHRVNAINTAEEHQHHVSELMEKFYDELESAHAETESETKKTAGGGGPPYRVRA